MVYMYVVDFLCIGDLECDVAVKLIYIMDQNGWWQYIVLWQWF